MRLSFLTSLPVVDDEGNCMVMKFGRTSSALGIADTPRDTTALVAEGQACLHSFLLAVVHFAVIALCAQVQILMLEWTIPAGYCL